MWRCTGQRLQQRIGARSVGAGAHWSPLAPVLSPEPPTCGVMMVAALAGSLQRRRHFAEADRTVAVGVELVEDVVGLREVGAAGAERVFEFRFADLAVAIGVDLREQVLQRAGRAGRRRMWLRRPMTGLAPPAARSWWPAISAKTRSARKPGPELPAAAAPPERSNGSVAAWLKPVAWRGRRVRRGQRLEGVQCGRRGAKGKQHGRTPTNAATTRPLTFTAERSANAVPSRKTQ